jgi:asparagine synthase (glutamine-hydrolysing)
VLRSGDDPQNALLRHFAKGLAQDPVSELLYVDTKTYLVGDILTKVDRMSMLNSLEVRVPILDHQFLEWVTGLPAEWKLRGGAQKYILRKLAVRVGVPRAALDRPKQGFALPLVHWMRNELKELLTILLEPRTLLRGYFQAEGVRKLMNDHLHGRRESSARIWRLLMFELWHRNFLERFTKPAGLVSLPLVADSRRTVSSSSLETASAPMGE